MLKKNYVALEADETVKTLKDVYFRTHIKCGINIYDTDWYLKIRNEYFNKIGSVFLIHGNIYDQVIPSWYLEDYLKEKLIQDLNIRRICTLDYIETNGNNKLSNGQHATFDGRLMETLNFLKEDDGDKKALILKYPQFIFPLDKATSLNNQEKSCILTLHNALMSKEFRATGNMIFILVEDKCELNSLFTSTLSRVQHIDVPMPDRNSRAGMVKHLKENTSELVYKNVTEKGVIDTTAGLGLEHIEQIWFNSLSDGFIDINTIRDYKSSVLKKEYSDVLEITEPDKRYSLNNYGGMDYIKDYLRDGVILPIQTADKSTIPKGLLFMGSCGTGKSYMAKCLASESGISFVELRMDKIEDKWVGSTERNLDKALRCIKALSPCFVFIDEIDQMLQRGDNDTNDTRSNIFQRMMAFMSDNSNRGEVIFIGATNYPNKIDEAIKRAGRFDVKLVFTPPVDAIEVENVLEIQLNLLNYPVAIEKYDSKYSILIKLLNGYSQAEIELVCIKALSLAKRRFKNVLDIDLILEAAKYIRRTSNEKIDEMIALAVNECNDLEFLHEAIIKKYCNKNNEGNQTW